MAWQDMVLVYVLIGSFAFNLLQLRMDFIELIRRNAKGCGNDNRATHLLVSLAPIILVASILIWPLSVINNGFRIARDNENR